MIEIQNLAARAGSFELRDISLSLESGQTLVLLGPSGAGKTVLLETVMGVLPASHGRVLIGGQDILPLPAESRNIAYIPQDLGLFPHLGVRDNILFGLRARRLDLATASSRLAALAERLQIVHLLGRPQVQSLSGGEKQRVALARALIVEPQVLFLDEPFSGLDRVARQEAVAGLRTLKAELGTTMIHVTHDLDEAAALADDLAIVIAGRIVQQGTREAVLSRPANRAVASLLLLTNLIPVAAIPDQPAVGEPRWWVIPPEEILLHPATTGQAAGLVAQVLDLIPQLGHWRVRLEVQGAQGAFPLEARVPPVAFRRLGLAAGDLVTVQLPREALIPLSD